MARASLTSPVKGVLHTSVGDPKRSFVVEPAADVLKSLDAEERFNAAFTREQSKADRKERRSESIERIMRDNRMVGI